MRWRIEKEVVEGKGKNCLHAVRHLIDKNCFPYKANFSFAALIALSSPLLCSFSKCLVFDISPFILYSCIGIKVNTFFRLDEKNHERYLRFKMQQISIILR